MNYKANIHLIALDHSGDVQQLHVLQHVAARKQASLPAHHLGECPLQQWADSQVWAPQSHAEDAPHAASDAQRH